MINSTDLMLHFMQEAFDGFWIQPTTSQYQQFARYYEYLVQVNQRINLTRITEPKDVAVKHFFDSITVFQPEAFPNGAFLADIGTGAGFPGVPLAIMRPDLKIVLVDSLNKRTRFLLDLVDLLELNSVQVVHSRAEDFARDPRYREKFDFVLARAVASLNILVEYCLPVVKLGGWFLAMKGPRAQEEVEAAQNAIKTLGGGKIDIQLNQLPLIGESRVIVKVSKTKRTPVLYPRKPGLPEKQPLK